VGIVKCQEPATRAARERLSGIEPECGGPGSVEGSRSTGRLRKPMRSRIGWMVGPRTAVLPRALGRGEILQLRLQWIVGWNHGAPPQAAVAQAAVRQAMERQRKGKWQGVLTGAAAGTGAGELVEEAGVDR
jgi:hypothetical protein